ncbi:MAG: DNA/RNA nuclease SfsA [Oscillospiraceae bacterium]|nr:DNA/RNA nuclease SfsA [Oscillospiraceae bacterium]
MKYQKIVTGVFRSRPNRFVAMCEVEGQTYRCHVKNTGRCRELLIPGVQVYLQDRRGEGGSTDFSLIAVKKGDQIVNIDSQAPNAVVKEALLSGSLVLPGFEDPDLVRGEYTFGDSRLDFYIEKGSRKGLVEVKGVTLEVEGAALFPDAPTQRGIKHLNELAKAEGYDRFVIFVIQMKGVALFSPNNATHPQFGQSLKDAQTAGVTVLAFDCDVTEDSLILDSPIPVVL